MEEIVEEAGRGVWAVVRFLLWHVLFELILFNVGRIVLLALSFGQFPRARHLPRYQSLVGCVGIAVISGAWIALVVFNRAVGAA